MDVSKKHFYNFGGLNRDVNPFMNKESDCILLTNFYTPKFGVKKVRYGYAPFLNAVDNQPVRNLIYYNFPSGSNNANISGVLRYSNSKLYNYPASGSTWGSSIHSFTSDVVLGTAQLSGTSPFVHLTNIVDGYHTFDGAIVRNWNGQYTPSGSRLAAWNTRIFIDQNTTKLVESATDFNAVGRQLSGSVTVNQNSATVTGFNTKFTTEVLIGNIISFNNQSFVVLSITSDTVLTLAANYTGSNIVAQPAYLQYASDPFVLNPNDPAGGGSIPVDSINNGTILDIKSSIDRVHVYKKFGIYKFNGQIVMRMPFFGNVLSVCQTKNNIDYILATNGIWKNDGKQVVQADFGIQTIISDTIAAHGINNPVSFSFEDLTIFFIGTIRIGQGDEAIDVTNGCLVHDENYDEWFVWSLGHQMTAFGYYVNPTTNRAQLISGDVNGNTYIWGEEYSSDNGKPISFHLRTMYQHMGDPDKSKLPDRFSCSSFNADGVTLNAAINYTDEYREEQVNLPGFVAKDFFQHIRDFKTISLEFFGTTTTNRPELYGYTISWKDMEDRREKSSTPYRGR